MKLQMTPVLKRRICWKMIKLGKLQFVFSLASLLFVVFVCKQVLDEQQRDHGAPLFRRHRNDDFASSRSSSSSSSLPLVYFRRDVPLIWIGGVPRSGTTLMRAMLDAHPDVRCGAETRVIPRLLNMYQNMERADSEMAWLREAQLGNETLDAALGAYILTVIARRGPGTADVGDDNDGAAVVNVGDGGAPAAVDRLRLCNKDPFALRSMPRLLRIFPDSRFLLMVRDGRATAHSIVARRVTIKGFDYKTHRGALADWNRVLSTMYAHCLAVGRDRCLPVYYELLVLRPEEQMRRVLEFLRVDWNDVVLRHETTIGVRGGVFLSKYVKNIFECLKEPT